MKNSMQQTGQNAQGLHSLLYCAVYRSTHLHVGICSKDYQELTHLYLLCLQYMIGKCNSVHHMKYYGMVYVQDVPHNTLQFTNLFFRPTSFQGSRSSDSEHPYYSLLHLIWLHLCLSQHAHAVEIGISTYIFTV